MPSVSNFNKIKIVTLAQRGMSQAQISMDLRIPKSRGERGKIIPLRKKN
jgi:predicted XRE-type DNA-binding protein